LRIQSTVIPPYSAFQNDAQGRKAEFWLTFISEIKKIQPWIVFYKFDNFTEKAMGSSSQGKRAPKVMTRRMKAVAACAAHLKDLHRAHGRPPPDVQVGEGLPQRIAPVAPSSYCVSPADLCAELMR
jgi:hypothetical protein